MLGSFLVFSILYLHIILKLYVYVDPSLQKADKLKGRTVGEEGWLLCLSRGSYLHCRGMSTKSIKDAILEQ